MITIWQAMLLMAFGSLDTLLSVFAGTILHMRYLDRKLNKPAVKPPAPPTQDKQA